MFLKMFFLLVVVLVYGGLFAWIIFGHDDEDNDVGPSNRMNDTDKPENSLDLMAIYAIGVCMTVIVFYSLLLVLLVKLFV